ASPKSTHRRRLPCPLPRSCAPASQSIWAHPLYGSLRECRRLRRHKLRQRRDRAFERAPNGAREASAVDQPGDPAARLVLDDEPVAGSVLIAFAMALVLRVRKGG